MLGDQDRGQAVVPVAGNTRLSAGCEWNRWGSLARLVRPWAAGVEMAAGQTAAHKLRRPKLIRRRSYWPTAPRAQLNRGAADVAAALRVSDLSGAQIRWLRKRSPRLGAIGAKQRYLGTKHQLQLLTP